MKKGYVVLLIVFALMVMLMLIPAKRQYSETVTIACPPDAVTRFMAFTQQWKKWWPGQQTGDSTFDIVISLIISFEILKFIDLGVISLLIFIGM